MTVSTGDGPIGTSPYGDIAEHIPYTPPPRLPIVHLPFHPTDARAIEIFLDPNHYNLIPNPSFRIDMDGWVNQGLTANLDADAWVGQGLMTEGEGRLYYAKGFPLSVALPGDDEFYESTRSWSEYTFSVFAKGQDARVQLSLHGYRPDENDPDLPEADPSVVVHSPLMSVSSEDWERLVMKTSSRLADISAGTSEDFFYCKWVRPQVEVIEDGPDPQVGFSSFMLDPSEGVVADYFDGSMDEGGRDDYFWLGDPEDSISVNYFERLTRVRWLYEYIYNVAPVNRPVAIYFLNRTIPWDPDISPSTYLTSSLKTTDEDGPSLIETAVSQYGDLAAPLP